MRRTKLLRWTVSGLVAIVITLGLYSVFDRPKPPEPWGKNDVEVIPIDKRQHSFDVSQLPDERYMACSKIGCYVVTPEELLLALEATRSLAIKQTCPE